MPDRSYREKNREAIAAYARRYRAKNREALNANGRRYRQENREAISARRAVLRLEKIARDGHEGDRARGRRSSHGSDYPQVFAEMWAEQDGRCYLCEEPFPGGRAEVDHDHSCCPPRKSCSACRRGLACTRCNRLIGQFKDDPALLRRMADNLESRFNAARLRIAAKPVQAPIADW